MADGNRLLISVERDDHISILMTDRDGAWPRMLVDDPGGDAWDARVSPDESLIAYVHRPFEDLNRLDLRVAEVETGEIRTLVGAPKKRAWSPRWSPDGSVLAFLSDQPDYNEAWLVRPDGEGARQLTRLGRDVGDISWAPDGRRLAGTVNGGGSFDLAVIDAGSGEAHYLGPTGGAHQRPRWSPDGAWLTVEFENPLRPPDLYRVDVQSGSRTQLTFSNPAALAANALVAPESISYASFDGLEIPAFLFRPEKPNGAVVVYPHGGPSSLYDLSWDILAQYFVARGYTWIAPNYRGSTGYGYEFEHLNYGDWGGGDTQDHRCVSKLLRLRGRGRGNVEHVIARLGNGPAATEPSGDHHD
jgi:dipeptidyl aminopeptidase/acylaminoacyl peptidase